MKHHHEYQSTVEQRTTSRDRALRLVLTSILLLMGLTHSVEAEQKLPFTDGWQLRQAATLVSVDDASVLRFLSGTAVQPNVALEDGTIELEVMMSGMRAFVYLQFRMDESGANCEEIYFRSHKTRAPDALQYSPVDNGISAWQMYHGTGKTGAVELPANEWIPVKLVVQGTRAAVFVGEVGSSAEPDLVIAHLGRKPQPGAIAVRGFIARGSEAPFSAQFRNVRIDPNRIDYDFTAVQEPEPLEAGTIEAWRLGRSFEPEALTVASLDEVPLLSRKGEALVHPDASGLLNIGREVVRPETADRWATVASVTLNATSAHRQRLDLGYSDAVSVFLDGELLFSADDSYSYDQPRRQGLIGLFQASLYLPLRAGDNELEIVVADEFGGWGLMGRLVDSGAQGSVDSVTARTD